MYHTHVMSSIVEIVREVLNENIREVRRLAAKVKNLHKGDLSESPINSISECGKSPLHIAVYKWNRKMVNIFLEAGANPNQYDMNGETAVHIAAKLGQYDILCDLYLSGRCDLSLRTARDKLTALELCSCTFDPNEDLVEMRNFKNWDRNQSDDTFIVQEGREKCASFLTEKMKLDHQNMLDTVAKESTAHLISQSKLHHILAEPEERTMYFTTGIRPEYPEVDGKCLVSEKNQESFEKYRIGVHNVAQDCFVDAFVYQSISVGFHRAAKVIVRDK